MSEGFVHMTWKLVRHEQSGQHLLSELRTVDNRELLPHQGDLVAVGVLSGNRNFEGRVHPNTRANYLASPPLVIAYAIAGTIKIDFEKEPLGKILVL